MLNLTAATATLFFVLENRSESLKDDFYAFAITICFYAANFAMLIEYRFRNSVVGVFEHLAEVYNTRTYEIELKTGMMKSIIE